MNSATGYILLTQLIFVITNVFGQGGNQEAEISFRMPEESPRNTHLGNLITAASLRSMYSDDIVDSFEFSILQGHYKSNFQVNPNTGDISTADPLDRESVCPYQDICNILLKAAIVKPIDYFQTINIDIAIEDKNDITPTFPQAVWVINISESMQSSAEFIIPPATDQDSTVYSIQQYVLEPQRDEFELTVKFNSDQSQDIRLSLVRQLDREVVNFYSMTLKALDGDNPPRTGTMLIEINVVDSNDNSPLFDQEVFNVTVAENYPKDMAIVRIHAVDKDDGANGEVRYKLSPQSKALFGETFQVDQLTGDIILKQELDYETKDAYSLTVQANDLGVGSLPATAKVMVYVQDVNDHRPELTVSGLSVTGAVEISENSQIGAPFAYISVEDRDRGISGQVACESLDVSLTLEQINDNSYKLVTQRLFDYEVQTTYQVTIVCTDLGTPQLTSSSSIQVAIIDENDNPPVFRDPRYALSIPENNTVGDVILSVAATDKDSGNNGIITYRLSENVLDLFEISDSGLIRAKVVLDHEQMEMIQFSVMATDGGSPSLSKSAPVILTLIDINDESPIFTRSSYNFGTYENQPIGTEIGIISAEDPDSPPFNDFTFSLDMYLNAQTAGSFEIDPKSGKITTKKVLDREHINTHVLKVWAVNTASPRLSSSVNVTITVADKNDNAPLILFPNKNNSTVQVPANALRGYIFSRIQATDADLAENAKLDFSIAGGNSENLFDIDYINGALSVRGDLSQAQKTTYEVLVVVKDKGEDPKKAVAVVYVVINSTLLMTIPLGQPGVSTPENQDDENSIASAIISASHQKILIVLGVVTIILVIVLVSAIIYIRRRQAQQERELAQNGYKVEVCQSHGGDESAPLDNLQNEFKVKVDPENVKTPPHCVEPGRTHLTLEDLKRMKCLYRDRPDITQNTPAGMGGPNRSTSPVISQSPSYSTPHKKAAPQYDGILDLLERQPIVSRSNQPDAESTGSNTDSGRGTSEPAHDLSGGGASIGVIRNSTEDFNHANNHNHHKAGNAPRTLGNLAPVHVYLKEKNNGGVNGSVVSVRTNNSNGSNRNIAPPLYNDVYPKPTHVTFQSPTSSPSSTTAANSLHQQLSNKQQAPAAVPSIPPKLLHNKLSPGYNHQQPLSHKNQLNQNNISQSSINNIKNSPYSDRSCVGAGGFSSFKGPLDSSNNNSQGLIAPRAASEISESCDNASLASTTSGEYVIQLDNAPVQSVNV